MVDQINKPSPELLLARMRVIAVQRERAHDELAVLSVEYQKAMTELEQARASIQALQAELSKFNPRPEQDGMTASIDSREGD